MSDPHSFSNSVASARVKPSKSIAAVGFVAGLVFVGFGAFVVIPTFGRFGFVWTAIAAVITAYHGFALISKRGVAAYEVELSAGAGVPSAPVSLEARLSDLKMAHSRGLITTEEYQAQRARTISST
jgi:hypothetical protein